VPGTREDLDPFVGEHADNGMEGFFSGLMVTHKGTSPSRMFLAFGGSLMEALPQEVWAVQTAHDRAGAATLAGDRSDAAVTLQGGGRRPAGAILSVGSLRFVSLHRQMIQRRAGCALEFLALLLWLNLMLNFVGLLTPLMATIQAALDASIAIGSLNISR
jgi:hypothetical protein